MKRLTCLLIMMVLIPSLFGCGREYTSGETVAKFFEYAENNKFDKALHLLTKETQEGWKDWEEEYKEVIKGIKPAKEVERRESQSRDFEDLVAEYTWFYTDGTFDSYLVLLKKEEGSWRIVSFRHYQ